VIKLVAAPAQHDQILKEFVATARVVVMGGILKSFGGFGKITVFRRAE
jgi:hypothetical protein